MSDEEKNGGQILLFEVDEEWRDHWKNMPEFVQPSIEPVKSIIVNFETIQDIRKFAELVGQTITIQTRSIWYPEAEIGHHANKRYLNGS